MSIDEAMKYWRMASKKFDQTDKQPEDYRNFARRIEALAKKVNSVKLAKQWTEQAETYRFIAKAVDELPKGF